MSPEVELKLWKTVVFVDHRRDIELCVHVYEDQITGRVDFSGCVRDRFGTWPRWEPPLELVRIEP
jgi:hypothetical protein